MKRVYLDNAATTRLIPEVLNEMLPYMTDIYGNPSSPHYFGQQSAMAVDRARQQVASAINADPSEIIFMSGGSEADNTAIRGIAERYSKKGRHIITTAVEHHAVLHTCQLLEKQGYEVTYLPVDEYGMVTAEQVRDAMRDDTILVTIMFANNEVGTIMPIAEIGKLCRERKVFFHTDAVQAVGHLPIDVQAMNIDMLSMSAHKFHGPKGIGALYVRKGIIVPALIVGGAQERNRRAGTENVPGIVGMGKAIELACSDLEAKANKMMVLRDKLIREIPLRIPEVKLNGHPTNRLPNNVNYSIKYIEGESILLMLDLNGIAASSGSACTSGSLDPSHVLLAMGLTHEVAHGSVRMTLCDDTTEEDIDYVLEVLPKVAAKLRDMSPLYHA
ncbi:MAG: cysteine desulfurase NifS [Clostridia bacterium]|nr:cysteine desulfurase NifS [Clostridia bacterium]MBQ3849222.1 cysteine desulfurase NifS [Clostridia bacterium]MBR3459182.1 cysteine desulfurase NifS [Clostridia bacterium]MBR5714047.1 cysteine desulfurase NifS [Clostridia bacterium]